MISFIISLAVLICGYFTYGYFVEKLFGVEPKKDTPAIRLRDNVDYIPMPTWKVFLIQFLNIAGLGPIFGAIMGIMFGPSAFIWIALGTIFAGGVHDFFSGMISLRKDGASLPEIIGEQLGVPLRYIMRVFSIALMILVGAVFVINPAQLLSNITPESLNLDFWIYIILGYYLLATLLPIDKLIGNIYPIFGFALLFMAVGILGALFIHGWNMPEFTDGLFNRQANPESNPIFPMLFISIACGAISGFHATQSPMMARCIKNENKGRLIFYGSMVTEGIVALIWAAAAIAFTGSFDNLASQLKGSTPAVLINDISTSWLGTVGGLLAVLGVICAPITTGDTALRSARIMLAESFKINQSSIYKRLLVSIPIFFLSFLFMKLEFEVLWRYFAWLNQTLAVFTLWAITVYLAREHKNYLISMIPAMFMTIVTITFILFAPIGFNLPYYLSITLASMICVILLSLFIRYIHMLHYNALISSRN